MAVFIAQNLALVEANPSEKLPKGERSGEVKMLYDKWVPPASVVAIADVVRSITIPAGSRVVDAYVKISKSLGATGIFDLGYAADPDAFVKGADGGGQAALQRANQASVLHQVFANDTEVQLVVTEATDGSVGDALVEIVVFYVNA